MANDYELISYKADNGQEITVSYINEDVWLTQKQIAQLFNTDRTSITKHIRNIFKAGELDKFSVCVKNAHIAEDRKTYLVDYYNLDMIISIGFRVNSKRGVKFRLWANKIIKEKIVNNIKQNKPEDEKIEHNITIVNYMDLANKITEQENIRARNIERLKSILAKYDERISNLENMLLNAKKVTFLSL